MQLDSQMQLESRQSKFYRVMTKSSQTSTVEDNFGAHPDDRLSSTSGSPMFYNLPFSNFAPLYFLFGRGLLPTIYIVFPCYF